MWVRLPPRFLGINPNNYLAQGTTHNQQPITYSHKGENSNEKTNGNKNIQGHERNSNGR